MRDAPEWAQCTAPALSGDSEAVTTIRSHLLLAWGMQMPDGSQIRDSIVARSLGRGMQMPGGHAS